MNFFIFCPLLLTLCQNEHAIKKKEKRKKVMPQMTWIFQFTAIKLVLSIVIGSKVCVK